MTETANAGLMWASVFHEYGGLDVLRYEQVPRPPVGRDDVLIRVHATGVNAFDLMVREGRYKPNKTFPHILGEDIAGTVAALGPEVREPFRIGQRVFVYAAVGCGRCEMCLAGSPNVCVDYRYFGAHLPGGYAQYVAVPSFNVIPMPEGITFEEGAAFVLNFLTAWHELVTRAQVRPGETVLVLAAGSGIGIAAIQILKLVGCRVIATASTEEKLRRAKALGADELINYREQDFQKEVMRLTAKRGVDVVFENVGSTTWDQSVRSLTRGGRLVTCGGTAGYDVTMSVAYVFHKELTIIGSNHGTKPELLRMLPLLAAGKLRPVVDRVFPLQEARAAHEYIQDRRVFGKVVLVPEHD
jgi:2-desacetyl-2-hydroxyethyl bacteriochlorophyllide A dehydrogenase